MNEKEIKEFYKNTFNTVADGYDSSALRFFPQSAARIPTYLGLQGHEHVLDIATGTGAAVMALAAFLTRGKVTGIDFSKNMLARAGRKVAEKGFDNVTLQEMDMQQIDFPDRHFDAATCCFGLFFVEDMAAQLKHMAAKVKADGRIIITSFYEDSFSPPVDLFFSCLSRYGIEPPTLTWKRVATQEKCRDLFAEAGLEDIAVEMIDSGYFLNSPDEWWQIVWNGGFRGLVQQLAVQDLARFKEELFSELKALSNGRGIQMNMGIIYTVGKV